MKNFNPEKEERIEGERVLWFGTVSSTMEVGEVLGKSGFLGIVVARCQTKGRGRFGRVWKSPEGGLYFSWVTKVPETLNKNIWQLVSLALFYTLRKLGLSDCQIKFPNDIITSKGKLAGILIEQKGENTIMGIGVNIRADLKETGVGSASILSVAGRILEERKILETFIQNFRHLVDQFLSRPDSVLAQWGRCLKNE